MAFSEDRALPGAALRLELEAAPGSLCAVRAVDRSVLLLKPEAELNTEAVSGGTAQVPFCSPWDQPGMGWGGRDDTCLDLPYGDSVPWWLLGSPAPGQGVGACLVFYLARVFIPRSTKYSPPSTTLEAFETQHPVQRFPGTIPPTFLFPSSHFYRESEASFTLQGGITYLPLFG